ncbi:MAG: endonuclease III domain-containing protein [Planctomycetota bacterium]
MYDLLLARFGPQHWWPGDTPFEVAVGAILTQNTNWTNVERAIANLKRARALSVRALLALSHADLAALLRPAGYFNVKAMRLRAFLLFLETEYRGSMKRFAADPRPDRRARLLAVKGIGPETADSILLYALDEPTFVVDAYTRRILSRHRLIEPDASYDAIRNLFEDALERDARLYNEYHALLVACGKRFCRSKMLCSACPLRPLRRSARLDRSPLTRT